MNTIRLLTAMVAGLALASVSCSTLPNWAESIAPKVTSVQIAALKPAAGNQTAPLDLEPFMTIEGPLAGAMAADMARAKRTMRRDATAERGPFLVLRSAAEEVLGICELPPDGGFIPYGFQSHRGKVLPGERLVKPNTRYRGFPNPQLGAAILRLWRVQTEPPAPANSQAPRALAM